MDVLEGYLDHVSDLSLQADSLRQQLRELYRDAEQVLADAKDAAEGLDDVYVQTKEMAILAQIEDVVEGMNA